MNRITNLICFCGRCSQKDFTFKASLYKSHGCARGLMVIVVGNGHDEQSSSPERGYLHFT